MSAQIGRKQCSNLNSLTTDRNMAGSGHKKRENDWKDSLFSRFDNILFLFTFPLYTITETHIVIRQFIWTKIPSFSPYLLCYPFYLLRRKRAGTLTDQSLCSCLYSHHGGQIRHRQGYDNSNYTRIVCCSMLPCLWKRDWVMRSVLTVSSIPPVTADLRFAPVANHWDWNVYDLEKISNLFQACRKIFDDDAGMCIKIAYILFM